MTALGLPRADRPQDLGLSPQRLERITRTLRADVERRLIPGAVMVIARAGRVGYAEAFGFRDREAQAPMTMDAIFRVASMTKPLTSVAAMMLAEEGSLQISAPVAEYLPEFKERTVGVERIARRADDDRAGFDAPYLRADLCRVRRLAGADDLARRRSDERGPDQRRTGVEARGIAADVRAGDDLGIQHVDRCAGARRRGGFGPKSRRVFRRADHRSARHGRYRIRGDRRSAPNASPSRRPTPPPAPGRRCATSAARIAGPRAAAGWSRPRPITCAFARCC